MESLFKALTPDGRIAVEVKVPVEVTDAEVIRFKCSVTVLSDSLDVGTVIEELETDDQNKMLSWMQRQMIEAMRRTA